MQGAVAATVAAATAAAGVARNRVKRLGRTTAATMGIPVIVTAAEEAASQSVAARHNLLLDTMVNSATCRMACPGAHLCRMACVCTRRPQLGATWLTMVSACR